MILCPLKFADKQIGEACRCCLPFVCAKYIFVHVCIYTGNHRLSSSVLAKDVINMKFFFLSTVGGISEEFPAIAISTNDCHSSCIKHDNGGGQ